MTLPHILYIYSKKDVQCLTNKVRYASVQLLASFGYVNHQNWELLNLVDPGVGGFQRAIALQLPDGFLVRPDNGIFSGILSHRHQDISPVRSNVLLDHAFATSLQPLVRFQLAVFANQQRLLSSHG
ncbi:MAG: SAM-dependent chlorinase/fluorinase [Tolypothrix brevis GSE-NOS-MK-07-07A]|nr:SAM-dependent chlorinase/fluorinase [Tolypothrix brevis GSE-NOS-MK-07-07A]